MLRSLSGRQNELTNNALGLLSEGSASMGTQRIPALILARGGLFGDADVYQFEILAWNCRKTVAQSHYSPPSFYENAN